MFDLKNVLIGPNASIREAMERIDRNSKGIALVCERGRLLGTVTDGDIRRAILTGADLDAPVSTALARKGESSAKGPVAAQVGTDQAVLLKMMRDNYVRQIPLLDEGGVVRGLATMDDLMPEEGLPMEAVIMAGGFGRRLHPLTEHVPKPMLPVGDRPLLERTIQRLKEAGVQRVNLTTHYKSEIIQNHFRDGSDFGVKIRYVEEDRPLGTAGALGRLNGPEQPLLIINGDILTNIDFRAMFEFHRENDAFMTVAVKLIELPVPYGVLEINGSGVKGITEKPVLRHFVNAGIFLVNPEACGYVPAEEPYDMPDLINRLIAAGKRVEAFPIREYWLDIGQMEQYRQAQDDVVKGEV